MTKRGWLVLTGALLVLAMAPGAVAEEHDEEGEMASGSALSVKDKGFGTDVVERELVGQGERFEEGRPVVFWTRVLGGAPGDRIYHVWMHKGKEIVKVGLSIGGSHWRTYSRKQLPPGSAGKWKVEVRDEAGNVLATGKFNCVRPGQAAPVEVSEASD